MGRASPRYTLLLFLPQAPPHSVKGTPQPAQARSILPHIAHSLTTPWLSGVSLAVQSMLQRKDSEDKVHAGPRSRLRTLSTGKTKIDLPAPGNLPVTFSQLAKKQRADQLPAGTLNEIHISKIKIKVENSQPERGLFSSKSFLNQIGGISESYFPSAVKSFQKHFFQINTPASRTASQFVSGVSESFRFNKLQSTGILNL